MERIPRHHRRFSPLPRRRWRCCPPSGSFGRPAAVLVPPFPRSSHAIGAEVTLCQLAARGPVTGCWLVKTTNESAQTTKRERRKAKQLGREWGGAAKAGGQKGNGKKEGRAMDGAQ